MYMYVYGNPGPGLEQTQKYGNWVKPFVSNYQHDLL
jgi:hypothetical protein